MLRELLLPLVVIAILLNILVFGIKKDNLDQKTALDKCAVEVRSGKKKAIDCQLMKLKFELKNEQIRSNMMMGAAIGAAAGASR